MKPKNLDNVLNVLLKHGRREILRNWRPDSCIASTRIGVDILRYFGFQAEPVKAKAIVLNSVLHKRLAALAENGELGKDQTQPDPLKGEWSVGLGYGEPAFNKWVGHLVAIVQGDTLLDLSLDQASRPKYNLELHPLAAHARASNVIRRENIWVIVLPSNHVLRYELDPHDGSFLSAPDWWEESRHRPVIERIFLQGFGEPYGH